jgi:hypothetical protein
MKSLKLFSFLAVVTILMAFVPAVFAQAPTSAPFSNANLQGKYLFQMQGTTNSYGYDTCDTNGNCVWTDVPAGGSCPSTVNCGQSAFTKYSFGYAEFDGNGNVTYIALTEYHPVGGPGPITNSGTSYGTYAVSASGSGSITIHGGSNGPVYFEITDVNPTTGIAGGALMHQPSGGGDAGATEAGVARHQ